MAKLTKLEQKTLDDAIVATQAGSYIFASEDLYQPLVDAGLVEVNAEISNEAGEIAVRAILPTTQPEEQKGAVKMSFVIEDNIAMPAMKRFGASREAKYPFDALQVGQSFFIPATEKHPEPAKSLASTISGATKRYDEEIPGETKQIRVPRTGEVRTVPKTVHTRVFQIRPVEGGARVWRTQ